VVVVGAEPPPPPLDVVVEEVDPPDGWYTIVGPLEVGAGSTMTTRRMMTFRITRCVC
jgi:hypothetical protein